MTYPQPSGSRPVTPVPPADPNAVTSTLPPHSPRVEPVQTHLPPRPAHTQRRKHKTPLGWLPWALLGLLGLLLALSLLAGALAGKDTSDDGADAARAGSGTAAGTATKGGTLTVGSTDVLGSRANLGRIGTFDGQKATGNDVVVQSVVADEGFWVGSSAAERVFVYLTPEARKSSGESGFQVKAGQNVDLTGTVAEVESPAKLGVTDAEGARQLAGQGAYVVADSVRLSS